MKAKWLVGLLTVFFITGVVGVALAQGQGAKHGQVVPKEIMDKLSAEQKQQLMDKIKELRDKQATPDEIRAAVRDMLKGWNLELPEAKGGRGAKDGQAFGRAPWMDKLTPDQKQQLLAKIKELREKNATREETRTAVQELLKGWGIDPGPALERKNEEPTKLTAEEKTALQAAVKELCDKDATREEILAAVREKLGMPTPGLGRAPWMDKLTAEQKEQLQAKLKELREKNATREEMKAAVQELLKGWGIDPGKAGAGGNQGQNRKRGGQAGAGA